MTRHDLEWPPFCVYYITKLFYIYIYKGYLPIEVKIYTQVTVQVSALRASRAHFGGCLMIASTLKLQK